MGFLRGSSRERRLKPKRKKNEHQPNKHSNQATKRQATGSSQDLRTMHHPAPESLPPHPVRPEAKRLKSSVNHSATPDTCYFRPLVRGTPSQAVSSSFPRGGPLFYPFSQAPRFIRSAVRKNGRSKARQKSPTDRPDRKVQLIGKPGERKEEANQITHTHGRQKVHTRGRRPGNGNDRIKKSSSGRCVRWKGEGGARKSR